MRRKWYGSGLTRGDLYLCGSEWRILGGCPETFKEEGFMQRWGLFAEKEF